MTVPGTWLGRISGLGPIRPWSIPSSLAQTRNRMVNHIVAGAGAARLSVSGGLVSSPLVASWSSWEAIEGEPFSEERGAVGRHGHRGFGLHAPGNGMEMPARPWL